MKTVILSAILSVAASSAHAQILFCTTNIDHDVRKASTDISISTFAGKTMVSQTTQGGMAHFITAPRKFEVSTTHIGPEVAVYSNEEEGFELKVVFQPINGQVNGTLITDVFGQRLDTPVVCSIALD